MVCSCSNLCYSYGHTLGIPSLESSPNWFFHLPRLANLGWTSYTFKAINIAKGYEIPPVQQPAVRPFYSIVLACLDTWTGFSLVAVSALNIVIGGVTAALIYLCGALVFNRLCAFGAALFFAIDPTQLIQTPQAGTEPLGLLFLLVQFTPSCLLSRTGGPPCFSYQVFLLA